MSYSPMRIAHSPRAPGRHATNWSIVRFWLGMAQMAVATIAAVLLIETGMSVWSLVGAMIACALTAVSVLLFGSKRQQRSSRHRRNREP